MLLSSQHYRLRGQFIGLAALRYRPLPTFTFLSVRLMTAFRPAIAIACVNRGHQQNSLSAMTPPSYSECLVGGLRQHNRYDQFGPNSFTEKIADITSMIKQAFISVFVQLGNQAAADS